MTNLCTRHTYSVVCTEVVYIHGAIYIYTFNVHMVCECVCVYIYVLWTYTCIVYVVDMYTSGLSGASHHLERPASQRAPRRQLCSRTTLAPLQADVHVFLVTGAGAGKCVGSEGHRG